MERDETLKLRDFPTLAHVVGWSATRPARRRAGAGRGRAECRAEPPPLRRRRRPSGDEITDAVVGIVAELTGYPSDLLDVDLDLEADLGVDTVKQAECSPRSASTYGVERDDTLSCVTSRR